MSCPRTEENGCALGSETEEAAKVTILPLTNNTSATAVGNQDVSTASSTGDVSTWVDLFSTISSVPGSSATSSPNSSSGFGSEVMIPLYSIIFVLSVVGNILVIVTLTQNRRMRTVTNVFLLNLAVADLLLGVFCMPFTLIGQLLRDFIFGSFMCKIIPYFQAVSVSVGVWTLVAISLERYFAICRPLKSRIWQTRSHAYKMIIAVWLFSLSLCLPVAILSRLKPIRDGRHKCREEWPDARSEKAYNLLLDVILLVLPILIMALAYWLIAARLWRGLRNETGSQSSTRMPRVGAGQADVVNPLVPCSSTCTERVQSLNEPTSHLAITSTDESTANAAVVIQWPRGNHRRLCCNPPAAEGVGPQHHLRTHQSRFLQRNGAASRGPPGLSTSPQQPRPSNAVQIMDYRQAARFGVRSTYTDKTIWAKKKVIRMLFVIVFEFFLCWAPLYVINTWYAFDPGSLYNQMGPTEIGLIQLLAYLSSCCNPITYCFMNEKFRNAFLSAFGCGPQGRGFGRGGPNRSTDLLSASFNDSFNLGRRSVKGKPTYNRGGARNSRLTSNTATTDIVETSLCGDELVMIHHSDAVSNRNTGRISPLME